MKTNLTMNWTYEPGYLARVRIQVECSDDWVHRDRTGKVKRDAKGEIIVTPGQFCNTEFREIVVHDVRPEMPLHLIVQYLTGNWDVQRAIEEAVKSSQWHCQNPDHPGRRHVRELELRESGDRS